MPERYCYFFAFYTIKSFFLIFFAKAYNFLVLGTVDRVFEDDTKSFYFICTLYLMNTGYFTLDLANIYGV